MLRSIQNHTRILPCVRFPRAIAIRRLSVHASTTSNEPTTPSDEPPKKPRTRRTTTSTTTTTTPKAPRKPKATDDAVLAALRADLEAAHARIAQLESEAQASLAEAERAVQSAQAAAKLLDEVTQRSTERLRIAETDLAAAEQRAIQWEKEAQAASISMAEAIEQAREEEQSRLEDLRQAVVEEAVAAQTLLVQAEQVASAVEAFLLKERSLMHGASRNGSNGSPSHQHEQQHDFGVEAELHALQQALKDETARALRAETRVEELEGVMMGDGAARGLNSTTLSTSHAAVAALEDEFIERLTNAEVEAAALKSQLEAATAVNRELEAMIASTKKPDGSDQGKEMARLKKELIEKTQLLSQAKSFLDTYVTQARGGAPA